MVDEEECESIVLNDKYSSDSYKYRYKYTATVTNEGKRTCTEIQRNCEEFNTELTRDKWTSIPLMDYLVKKCIYNNNDQSCTPKARTCSEIYIISNQAKNVVNDFQSHLLTNFV